MSPTRYLTLRYSQCILCTMGNNVPLSRKIAHYLPKLLISRKGMSLVRATSMLGRIHGRNLRV